VVVEAAPYDEFSSRYAEHAERNPFQRLYDRPAILAMAGDVDGKFVLDVGCAAGHLSAQLAGRGAEVLGVDASEELIGMARTKCGSAAEFVCADIREPLDFVGSGSVDLITASLVLHYLEDWQPTLSEFRRVLRPGGAAVVSVHHPEDWHWFEGSRYFETQLVTDTWVMAGEPQQVSFYRRPLSATFSAIRSAGFRVDDLDEPQPAPECRREDPRIHELLTTAPRFLYLRLVPES
jgi:SAM-dependent methyltransferase